jgi:uncharacterized protein YciI
MSLWIRMLLFTGPPDDVSRAHERHRDHLRELAAQGRLRVAGEFAPGDGAVEIFEAADRLEAESIARSSPLVEDGLASWILREWREVDGA